MGKTLLPLFLAAVAAATSGCGSKSTSSSGTTIDTTPTGTTAPTTTGHSASPGPTSLTIFRVQSGALGPETVRVPHTQAVAAAALDALGLAAPVTIADGTASVQLDDASPAEVAEIVYTLTEFPSIARVDVAGRTGLTRDDFAAYLPTIFIAAPAAGANVPSTFTVTGSAEVFEATLVVELVRGGKVLVKQSVTASEGAPARGTFETTLHAPSPGDATVTAFAPSAENGAPQHQVDVPVTVTH
jgi:hypothetical protein